MTVVSVSIAMGRSVFEVFEAIEQEVVDGVDERWAPAFALSAGAVK